MGYGGDPCSGDDSLPSWVWDYDVCKVCDLADAHNQDYPFAEYGIEECECIECSKCCELKNPHDDFYEGGDVCYACED